MTGVGFKILMEVGMATSSYTGGISRK
jgi:hypothetical protein